MHWQPSDHEHELVKPSHCLRLSNPHRHGLPWPLPCLLLPGCLSALQVRQHLLLSGLPDSQVLHCVCPCSHFLRLCAARAAPAPAGPAAHSCLCRACWLCSCSFCLCSAHLRWQCSSCSCSCSCCWPWQLSRGQQPQRLLLQASSQPPDPPRASSSTSTTTSACRACSKACRGWQQRSRPCCPLRDLAQQCPC